MKDKEGIYIGCEMKNNPVVLSDYQKSNDNGNNFFMGSIGHGMNFHAKSQELRDISKYFNKGNDCDACQNQYLCGKDGDATGCKCADNDKECNFIACKEEVILLKVSVASGFERLLGICTSAEEVLKMKSAFYEKWKVTYPRAESYQWIEKEYVLNELD